MLQCTLLAYNTKVYSPRRIPDSPKRFFSTKFFISGEHFFRRNVFLLCAFFGETFLLKFFLRNFFREAFIPGKPLLLSVFFPPNVFSSRYTFPRETISGKRFSANHLFSAGPFFLRNFLSRETFFSETFFPRNVFLPTELFSRQHLFPMEPKYYISERVGFHW